MKQIENSDVLYQHWPSTHADDTRACLLLIHGLGAHTGRWDFLAEYFSQQGFTAYGIELKGFGETKTHRGDINSFSTYYEDITKVYEHIQKKHPNKKIFIIGESMGGLIAFMMTIKTQLQFSGLVLISPAFANGLKFSLLDYINILMALLYNPKKQFIMPFDSAMCTRDKDYQIIMDKDKRETRLTTSGMLMNILKEQVKAQFSAKHLKIPTLFLLSGRDYLANHNVSRKIFKKLVTEDKVILEYPDMHHALSIDIGREKVFEDINGWIEKRL